MHIQTTRSGHRVLNHGCRTAILGHAVAMAGLLLAPAPSAHADPVVLPFNVVVGGTHGDMVPIFGTSVQVGDVIHGTLTYDGAAMASSSSPGFATYASITGSIDLSLGSGFSLPLDVIDVFDVQPGGTPFDLDTVAAAASTTSFPGFDSISVLVDFQGPPDSRSTTALPQSAAEFASFVTAASFRFEGGQTGVAPPFDESSHEILGRVELAGGPTPTPEPATAILVLTATGLLFRKPRS